MCDPQTQQPLLSEVRRYVAPKISLKISLWCTVFFLKILQGPMGSEEFGFFLFQSNLVGQLYVPVTPFARKSPCHGYWTRNKVFSSVVTETVGSKMVYMVPCGWVTFSEIYKCFDHITVANSVFLWKDPALLSQSITRIIVKEQKASYKKVANKKQRQAHFNLFGQ